MVLVDQRDEKIEVQQVSHRLGQVIFSEILHFIRSDDLSGFRYDQKPATSPLQARGFQDLGGDDLGGDRPWRGRTLAGTD
jgi:hypothetical protein